MKTKIICYGLVNTSQTINRFGDGWLIQISDRQFKLVGGSDNDLATAQEWALLFDHKIIFSQSQKRRCLAHSLDQIDRGFPARNTRNVNPRPFSNGSTVAVTSSTGYRTVASQ
jgi:hypothetical protein